MRAGLWLDPVQLPPATLDAIRGRYGAPGLEEVLAVLHWPEMHISFECTDRAARTLPYRRAHNVGGLFVDLVREALRGELLIDKLEDNARTRDAEAGQLRELYGGLDDDTLAALVERTRRHDPDKADAYRAELARRQALPKTARLAAAHVADDPEAEGDDDVAGIPWADLFARVEGDDADT